MATVIPATIADAVVVVADVSAVCFAIIDAADTVFIDAVATAVVSVALLAVNFTPTDTVIVEFSIKVFDANCCCSCSHSCYRC